MPSNATTFLLPLQLAEGSPDGTACLLSGMPLSRLHFQAEPVRGSHIVRSANAGRGCHAATPHCALC